MGWHGRLSTRGNSVNRVGAEVDDAKAAFRGVVLLKHGGGRYIKRKTSFSRQSLLCARGVHSFNTFLEITQPNLPGSGVHK